MVREGSEFEGSPMAKTRKTVIEQSITFFSVAPACTGSSPGLASAFFLPSRLMAK